MKPGFIERESGFRRPFVEAVLYFPLIGDVPISIEFLVDTGADRTTLSPAEGVRLREQYGLDLLSLPRGAPSRGIGGQMETRLIEATLTMDGFSTSMTVPIFEPPPSQLFPDWMPALLGRDIIREFAFHFDEFREQVLFLERDEADALDFPDS